MNHPTPAAANSRKAVFLDRDGVLNHEIGDYVWRPEDFVVIDGVPEARLGPGHGPPALPQRTERGVPAERAQADHRAERPDQQGHLTLQPGRAGVPLRRQGPVVRRRAAHRRG